MDQGPKAPDDPFGRLCLTCHYRRCSKVGAHRHLPFLSDQQAAKARYHATAEGVEADVIEAQLSYYHRAGAEEAKPGEGEQGGALGAAKRAAARVTSGAANVAVPHTAASGAMAVGAAAVGVAATGAAALAVVALAMPVGAVAVGVAAVGLEAVEVAAEEVRKERHRRVDLRGVDRWGAHRSTKCGIRLLVRTCRSQSRKRTEWSPQQEGRLYCLAWSCVRRRKERGDFHD